MFRASHLIAITLLITTLSHASELTLDDYVSIFEESSVSELDEATGLPIDIETFDSPLISVVPDLPIDQMTQRGAWAFEFRFITKDGTVKTLSSYRSSKTTKPASTLKLFTGWMGFKKKAVTDRFIGDTLKRSDNDQADKILAKAGGINRVKAFLKNNNINTTPENFKMIDGSGLSHNNRITVDIELALLTHIAKSADYDTFKKLLAIPGMPGSLVRWFKGVEQPIYAKTGTLRDTAALAGFVEFPSGTLVFATIGSNLIEDPRYDNRVSYNLIQTLVRKHVDYMLNPPESCVKVGPCFRVPDNIPKSLF